MPSWYSSRTVAHTVAVDLLGEVVAVVLTAKIIDHGALLPTTEGHGTTLRSRNFQQ